MTVIERILKNLRLFIIAIALILATFVLHNLGVPNGADFIGYIKPLFFISSIILLTKILATGA